MDLHSCNFRCRSGTISEMVSAIHSQTLNIKYTTVLLSSLLNDFCLDATEVYWTAGTLGRLRVVNTRPSSGHDGRDNTLGEIQFCKDVAHLHQSAAWHGGLCVRWIGGNSAREAAISIAICLLWGLLGEFFKARLPLGACMHRFVQTHSCLSYLCQPSLTAGPSQHLPPLSPQNPINGFQNKKRWQTAWSPAPIDNWIF